MDDKDLKVEIEYLKKEIISDNPENIEAVQSRLVEIGGKEIVDFLIKLIDQENPNIRNRAAIVLEEIKDNSAVEPLLNAIFKKENYNNTGTLVFALEALDCSQKLKEVFKILFFESYESKLHAYNILSEQEFEFTVNDLIEVQNMWNEYNNNPEKYQLYDDEETKEMMQDAIESFMWYLDPNNQTET
jgi:HEAT repeat protein